MDPAERARHGREPVGGTAIAANWTAGETGDSSAFGGDAARLEPLTCAPSACLPLSKPGSLGHDRRPTSPAPLHSASPAVGPPDACKQFAEYLMLGAAERGLVRAVRFLLSAQFSHPHGELTR